MKPLPSLRRDWNILENHNILINPNNAMNVEGLKLISSWKYEITEAAVIQGPGMKDAVTSAESQKLTVKEFNSYNITENLPDHYQQVEIKNIIVPEGHTDTAWVNQVRLMNHRLEYYEVARIFDHMAVWNYCITKGCPIVVLESISRLKSIPNIHIPRNSIIGLDTGGKLHRHNDNYRVMPGVWAYSIDQFSAKRMFNRVLAQGIRDPLELMFRADQQLILLEDHAYRVI